MENKADRWIRLLYVYLGAGCCGVGVLTGLAGDLVAMREWLIVGALWTIASRIKWIE